MEANRKKREKEKEKLIGMQNELEMQKGVENFQFISNLLSHKVFLVPLFRLGSRSDTHIQKTPLFRFPMLKAPPTPQLEAKLAEGVDELKSWPSRK